jgi:SAM-dependent methyltransferase
MDEAYNYNKERWEALVKAKALFTRPWFDLDIISARERLDRWGLLGDLNGKRVLCLAGGGGQQSVAFALLGAEVSVLDISDGQLSKDREAAAYYGVEVSTHQGDMRDLSDFADDAFDVVWHPYALNFVPDCRVVFRQVARVLRPGGLYHFAAANPFAAGMGTRDWNGDGYVVRRQYVEEALVSYDDEPWVFRENPEAQKSIGGPREYRQTLGRILNGLVECKLVIVRMLEWADHERNLDAEPGDWEHFTSYLPPWLWFWTLYRSDLALSAGPKKR